MNRAIPAIAVALALAAGCGGSDDGAAETSAETGGGGAIGGDAAGGAFRAAGDSVTLQAVQQGGPSAVPAAPPAVIRTAEITLGARPGTAEDVAARAGRTAARLGGFVVSSSGSDRDGTAHVVLRIPADRFDDALDRLRRLGPVRAESMRGEDVGLELVDLDARLRHVRAQERALLLLMRQADTVRDTIRVQSVLDGVQLEAERIAGRLRYLDDRVSLATVTVSVRERDAEPAAPGPIRRAWDRAVDAGVGVVAAVIVAVGVLVPLLALAALAGGAALAVRALVRRRRRPAAPGGVSP